MYPPSKGIITCGLPKRIPNDRSPKNNEPLVHYFFALQVNIQVYFNFAFFNEAFRQWEFICSPKLHFSMFWWISNTPLKTHMEPKKWRLDSDDFPFQGGEFHVNHVSIYMHIFLKWICRQCRRVARWIVLMLILYRRQATAGRSSVWPQGPVPWEKREFDSSD